MRNQYLEFTRLLTDQWQKLLRSVWWASALHEKNVNRFDSYHWIVNGIKPKNHFIILRAVYSGIRKYFAFLIRWFYFYFSGKPELRFCHSGRIIISYPNDDIASLYDKNEALLVILPQRKDWKRLSQKAEREWVIDNFMPLSLLLFKVPLIYFLWLSVFVVLLLLPFKISIAHHGEKTFGRDVWPEFRGEVWRSFAGDIFIEGLYYSMAFKNMSRIFLGSWKILYPYEGHAWEKMLCYWFKNAEKIGILSSIPSPNVMHYHYHPDEVMLMPKPDRIGVPGMQAKELMEKSYGDRVFILGTTRYEYLRDKHGYDKKRGILIVLGGVDRQAQAVIDWSKKKWEYAATVGSNVYLCFHPDNRKLKFPFVFRIVKFDAHMLARVRIVITFDSTVAIEAAAMGARVVVPELPEFIDLCPLEVRYRGRNCSRDEILNRYFTFRTRQEMRELLG